ncbi:MAG TPA: twin-arginine translocase TatA/TatE family subunit [Anaerolineaceae bacterium]
MPFGIQPIHLIVVAIVALLIFGPSRLPEIGRGVGKALTEFRRGAREMSQGFMEEVKQPDESDPNKIAPPSLETPADIVPAAGNFCIHCGKPNPAGARFCNNCGEKIAE